MPTQRLRGLYAITHHDESPDSLITDVAAAIQGGARLIQYRDKSGDIGKRSWEAQDLLNLCRSLGIPLLINDDLDLAEQIGADGVHLGRDDDRLRQARERLGPEAIIGATCYDSLSFALQAQLEGASYVAFGRFFPSPTKPQTIQAKPALLELAHQRLTVPMVAIGGITPENGGQLVKAGADMLAVISGIFSQPDILATVQRYAELFV